MTDAYDPMTIRLLREHGMSPEDYIEAVENYWPVVDNLVGDSEVGYVVVFRDGNNVLPTMAIEFNPAEDGGYMSVDYNWYQKEFSDSYEDTLRYLMSDDESIWEAVSDKAVHYLIENGLLDAMTPGWKLLDRGRKAMSSDRKNRRGWKFKPLISLKRLRK